MTDVAIWLGAISGVISLYAKLIGTGVIGMFGWGAYKAASESLPKEAGSTPGFALFKAIGLIFVLAWFLGAVAGHHRGDTDALAPLERHQFGTWLAAFIAMTMGLGVVVGFWFDPGRNPAANKANGSMAAANDPTGDQ